MTIEILPYFTYCKFAETPGCKVEASEWKARVLTVVIVVVVIVVVVVVSYWGHKKRFVSSFNIELRLDPLEEQYKKAGKKNWKLKKSAPYRDHSG